MQLAATEILAKFTETTSYEAFGDDVVAAAKAAFIDWIGCAALGSRTPAGLAAASLAVSEQGGPDAMLFSDGSLTSASWAAFANGAASYAIELDDVHMPSVMHGGVTVIPAAFAVAQKVGASGKRLLEAIVVGYDVAFRIGEAVAASHYERFHTTGTVGTFGAAAAVAKLLDLRTEQIQWALGNAGAQAAGLWQYLEAGGDTRVLHPAKAAMNGTIAAMLAARNFTGPLDMLEGKRGFFASMAGPPHWDRITDGLGSHFKIVENGFKIYSCCRHAHVAIDLTLSLCAEYDFTPEDIARVSVCLNPTSRRVLDDPLAATVGKAAFSAQYLLASAIAYKHIGLDTFEERSLTDPCVRNLMKRVAVTEEPAYLATFPKTWTTEISIETIDGRELRRRAELPEGDPANPLPAARLEAKCRELLSKVMSPAKANNVIERLSVIDSIADTRMLLPEIAGTAFGPRASNPPKARAAIGR